ncbi:DUF4369 domain-containing protein [Flavobacteriaceae bacterium F08102]|nr:DUF4369 domain-containing protein [Flavobacteriaceae bacterium F08102]
MMGKKKILSALIFSMCCSCQSTINQQNHFYIQGEADLKNGTKVYLKSQEFNEITTIDSNFVKNSRFTFSGSLDRPVIYGIYIENLPGVVGILMENDSITVKINPNNLSKSIVIGSELNNAFQQFQARSFYISSKIDQFYPLFQKARSENNSFKLKEINERMKKVQRASEKYAIQYAANNPDSYVAAYALRSVLNSPEISLDSIKMIYNKFTPFVKKGDFSLEILHHITERDSLP